MDVYVFPDIEPLDSAIRMGLALFLSALVGLEREWRDQQAGLRTHILVGVASAALTIVSIYAVPDYYAETINPEFTAPPVRDPMRLAAQIVSGIGFLGAGVIMRSGFTIRGLTTAASLWSVCAIGITAGANMLAVSGMLTFFILFSLTVLRYVNRFIEDRTHTDIANINVVLRTRETMDEVIEHIEHRSRSIESFYSEASDEGSESINVTAELVPGTDRIELGRELRRLGNVSRVRVTKPRRNN